jgi:hypothetical protein
MPEWPYPTKTIVITLSDEDIALFGSDLEAHRQRIEKGMSTVKVIFVNANGIPIAPQMDAKDIPPDAEWV